MCEKLSVSKQETEKQSANTNGRALGLGYRAFNGKPKGITHKTQSRAGGIMQTGASHRIVSKCACFFFFVQCEPSSHTQRQTTNSLLAAVGLSESCLTNPFNCIRHRDGVERPGDLALIIKNRFLAFPLGDSGWIGYEYTACIWNTKEFYCCLRWMDHGPICFNAQRQPREDLSTHRINTVHGKNDARTGNGDLNKDKPKKEILCSQIVQVYMDKWTKVLSGFISDQINTSISSHTLSPPVTHERAGCDCSVPHLFSFLAFGFWPLLCFQTHVPKKKKKPCR